MAAESRGLLADIVAAWGDPKASIRAQLATNPPESRLLAYVFVACIVGAVAGLPSAYRQAAALPGPDATAAVLTGRVFAALFFAPLLLYGIAALSRLVARVFGGRGTYYSARLALFWALCVSLPLLVISGVLGAIIPSGGGISTVVQLVIGTLFLWIWSINISETEYIKGSPRVFMVVLGLVFAILSILLLIRQS